MLMVYLAIPSISPFKRLYFFIFIRYYSQYLSTLYSGDAEIYNFRPGRFKTESTIYLDEWSRIFSHSNLSSEDDFELLDISLFLAIMLIIFIIQPHYDFPLLLHPIP